jgi:hypothetical protein
MKEEEQRKKSLSEVIQRQWNGGRLAVEGPISLGDTRKKSGGGGDEGEDAERR